MLCGGGVDNISVAIDMALLDGWNVHHGLSNWSFVSFLILCLRHFPTKHKQNLQVLIEYRFQKKRLLISKSPFKV